METNHVRWHADAAGAESACAAFLARHGAYRDGELTAELAWRHEDHARTCASCGRYARVLERGVDVLHELEAEPTPEFAARLQHRLFHLEDPTLQPRRRYVPATLVAALLAAAVLVPRVWEGGQSADVLGVHPHEAVFGRSAQLWEPAALPLAQPAQRAATLPVALYSPVVVYAPQYHGASPHAD